MSEQRPGDRLFGMRRRDWRKRAEKASDASPLEAASLRQNPPPAPPAPRAPAVAPPAAPPAAAPAVTPPAAAPAVAPPAPASVDYPVAPPAAAPPAYAAAPPAQAAQAAPPAVSLFPETPRASTADAPTILTVCTGNICRSPMAEVLLRARLAGLGVRVHSAGTHALVGHEMTEQARDLAVGMGAVGKDAGAHRARYLVEPLLKESDLVLTMAREHRSHTVQMLPSTLRRTFTVREFARLASTLTTEQARAAADAAGTEPRARLAAAIQAVAGQRGLSMAVQDEDDVIDPYRRSQNTYELSASQLAPALDEVERIVRAALA